MYFSFIVGNIKDFFKFLYLLLLLFIYLIGSIYCIKCCLCSILILYLLNMLDKLMIINEMLGFIIVYCIKIVEIMKFVGEF